VLDPRETINTIANPTFRLAETDRLNLQENLNLNVQEQRLGASSLMSRNVDIDRPFQCRQRQSRQRDLFAAQTWLSKLE
jgi:hypothetical protein